MTIDERRRAILKMIGEGKFGLELVGGRLHEVTLVPYRPGDERYGVIRSR